MADIYYCPEDPEEEAENVYGDFGGINSNAGLTPLEKMEKYASTTNILNRQMVPRIALETLRQVVGDPGDVESVFTILERLAEDVDCLIRSELMEQVPHIAIYCQEVPEYLAHAVPHHLLPLVVKFLVDNNHQVRKTSQAALLVLLEQGLVDKLDVELQVCPVILEFTEITSEDYRIEATALLSKMAPMIGREMSERLFLERFAKLCTDPTFHVRKVCAANFGDFCGVVGPEATEKILLPKFYSLCTDNIWGVRKCCADVFMPVSCICSPSVRKTELSPLFIGLLRDHSRWVRMAAFQALGPFISTFADPVITALLHNENGEIIITNRDELVHRLTNLENERYIEAKEKGNLEDISQNLSVTHLEEISNPCLNVLNNNSCNDGNYNQPTVPENAPGVINLDSKAVTAQNKDGIYSDNLTSDFSSFLYWREPVQSIDLIDVNESDSEQNSAEIIGSNDLKIDKELMCKDENNEQHNLATAVEEPQEEANECCSSEAQSNEKEMSYSESGSSSEEKMWTDLPVISFQKFDVLTGTQENSTIQMFGEETDKEHKSSICTFEPGVQWGSFSSLKIPRSSPSSGESDIKEPHIDPALPKGPPETEQNIVPQLLIDHYVSMIDPSRVQTVESDIARHCAFSFPAVALTLGRSNWPLLRETYETLANDMQWKVRRTLASSIHELAVILGEKVAAEDLVPIFNGFIKDLDEVRIGILKHLAEFLILLMEDQRKEYLPKMSEFLKMDNERNWRFRLELAHQLGMLCPVFQPDDIKEFLAPITLSLIQDKVAEVRSEAVEVLCIMFSMDHDDLNTYLIPQTIEKLVSSNHWTKRQTFCQLCSHLVQRVAYSFFTQEFLLHLLKLTDDRVPNVRLQVARVLGQYLPQVEFENSESPHHDAIMMCLKSLASDKDGDVREAVSLLGRVDPVPPVMIVGDSESSKKVFAKSDENSENDKDKSQRSWAEVAAE